MQELQTLSLPECRERLVKELGQAAPSLVTLKRWSSAGRYGDGKRLVDGKPRFEYAAVKQAALAGMERSTSVGAKTSRLRVAAKAGADAAATEGWENEVRGAVLDEEDRKAIETKMVETLHEYARAIAEQVREEVRESLNGEALRALIGDAVREEVAKLGGELVKAISSIDAIRKTLMLKYDGEVTHLKGRLAAIDEQAGDLERVSRSLQVLEIRTSQLLDRVGDLRRLE